MFSRRKFIASALCSGLAVNGEGSFKRQSLSKNIVLISNCYGFIPKNFFPDNNHLNSKYLKVFEDYHSLMTVFRGIGQDGFGGGHASHHGIYAAQCIQNAKSRPFVSLDQVIAENVLQETRLKSLAIATGRMTTSWSIHGHPIKPCGLPDLIDKIFNEKTNIDTLEKRLLFYKSLKSGTGLRKSYMDSLDALINKINEEKKWVGTPLPKQDRRYKKSNSGFADLPEMFNLVSKALEVGQCRIFNINIGLKAGRYSGHSSPYPFSLLDNISTAYHTLTHEPGKHGVEKLEAIEEFQLVSVKTFLDSLSSLNMLEDTLVMFVGGFGNSMSHSCDNLPIMLFGGGMDHLGIVECRAADGRRVFQLSDLYLSIAQYVGANIKHFAGNTTTMKNVIK